MTKLRLCFARSKGYVAVAGDMALHEDEHSETRILSLDVENWNSESNVDEEWFITSFVDRENKGEQPVPDDFPVVVAHRDSHFSERCLAGDDVSWNFSFTWKPDIQALLEMQHEHDKHNESIIKANKKESEMVYTQEMKDNGELPKVGMKVSLRGIVEQDRRNLDLEEHCVVDTWMNGDELMTVASVKMNKVDLTPVMQNLRTYEVSTVLFKLLHPMKSEREEAEYALIKKVADVLRKPVPPNTDMWAEESAKKLLEAGLLAEIILPLKRS